MLKLAYVAIGVAVLMSVLMMLAVSGIAIHPHYSPVADGGAPPADPIPWCLPPIIPCQQPTNGSAKARVVVLASSGTVLFVRREHAMLVRPS
jgi:hypothetical protein